jgi:hypothetical protein
MSSQCPVCTTDNVAEKPIGGASVTESLYICERCGEFILKFPSTDLPRMLNDDVEKRAVLSHWIRTSYEARQKEPPDEQGGRRGVRLSGQLVNSIIQNHPRPTVKEQADNLIRWIGGNAKIGGQYVNIDQLAVQAIVGSATTEEFRLVSSYLRKRELIDDGLEPRVRGKVTLSFAGWERYQELKRATSESRKAFMAMEYGHPELDSLFKDILKPAVKETGFDLFILPERPKAGLIDDRLRVEIRASRFLIADLTHNNRGAYWEAGYAEGLGKPVIYTCERKKFKRAKPHFDTNHHLTILWDFENPKNVAKELTDTIRATLPGEAKMPVEEND